MQILLNTAARKRFFVVAAAVCALAYVALAGTLFVASLFGDRAELSSLQRATRFDPGNADYRNHLGRYYALVARDPASAVEPYRAAVQLNPHSARYWFDLASAYQVQGDTSRQAWALENAIHADPTTPDVAWEAANLYLVQGQEEKALHEFRVVLENEPSLAGVAMQLCWRIKPDVDTLLRDVVPSRSEPLLAFLSLLMTKNETAGTTKAWASLMQTRESLSKQVVFDYVRYLILQKQPDQALSAWQQASGRFGFASYQPTANNLVVNGNFDLEVLNGGFDWQYQKQQSVTLTLDPSDFHSGHRSLLITFDGPGVRDAGIYQLVPVQPNTTYEFSAYYKIGDMEGAGAPHFTIQDMYTSAVLYESDELTEAGFWKSASGEFTAGADTKLVVLHVRRLPEGSPIRGKLWIDDFRIVQKQQ